jgi:(1->4)-alpha-D-glucan 1-alpha-D-glucosylmutase
LPAAERAVTDPAETDPAETDPAETDPAETDPAVTDPALSRAGTPGGASDPAGRRSGPRPAPVSTYRLQIGPSFTLGAAADQADYLAALGVSHAYLSPLLQPSPGSTHGYDVVDPSRINHAVGGRPALDRLSKALRRNRIGAVADVVPNHMAVPTPAHLNEPLWSVLRDGPGSPFADWFDVDWSVPDHAVMMPVLGKRIGQVLDAGELVLDPAGGAGSDELVLRYHDHRFPVRQGTEHLPLSELVDRQWYRLAHWRVADEELNYRRFFDVDSLAAVRVEDPAVFEATHRLLLELVAAGDLDGLRIDHPDGLADPAGYLARLADATGDVWVVVEKILEGSERLPEDWRCAGTTGYDALQRLGGLFVDPAGAAPLSALLAEITTDQRGFDLIKDQAKREVVAGSQYAEVHRLIDLLVEVCHRDVGLRDHTRRGLGEAVVELLVGMDRYRAYVVPGRAAPPEAVEAVEAAADRARAALPEHRHDTLDVVRDLVLGRRAGPAPGPRPAAEPTPRSAPDSRPDGRLAELVIRFQQTCGPVMAKGVEDAAFYRWFRLVALNEVGGDPEHFGVAPEELHAFFGRQQQSWPRTMTTLSTHDTKRSEDVRARLAVLSEVPQEWAELVTQVRESVAPQRDPLVDPATEYLLLQTVFGTWSAAGPISTERLVEYATKAVREAKARTSWTTPDEAYEAAVLRLVDTMLADPAVLSRMAGFVGSTAPACRATVLGQKLLQLVVPGVPDVYQGSELVDLSLVDPDNRRPVDYADRRRRLARIDAGRPPDDLDDLDDLDDEKLRVVTGALRLRRDHPDWFVGEAARYLPVATTTGNAVAVGRGDSAEPRVVAVVTRLAVSLQQYGGWRQHTVSVPPGRWRDVLTGRAIDGGSVPLAVLLADLPVALLHKASAPPRLVTRYGPIRGG